MRLFNLVLMSPAKKRDLNTRGMLQLTITLIAISVAGCENSLRCRGGDKTSGIINSTPAILCLPETQTNEFIISNDSAYRKIFPNCDLPAIDFSTETLL